MTDIFTYFFITIGIFFWFWGKSSLLSSRTVLYKIHNLTVSDSLGSILIIVGLLFQIPREFPLLILAIISIAIWNTMLSYVYAYCSTAEEEQTTITVENESTT